MYVTIVLALKYYYDTLFLDFEANGTFYLRRLEDGTKWYK